LHSDKDHQMPFVGGPHTRITNPRWRTAAILKKLKNCYISDYDYTCRIHLIYIIVNIINKREKWNMLL